jgi:hypothetical protein
MVTGMNAPRVQEDGTRDGAPREHVEWMVLGIGASIV